jgi:hypothetical protein
MGRLRADSEVHREFNVHAIAAGNIDCTYGNPSAQFVFSGAAPQLKITTSNQSVLWTNAPIFQAGNLTLAQNAFIDFGSLSLVMQGDGNLVL